MKKGINKHSLIFDGVCAYNRRFTQFLPKNMRESFFNKTNAYVPVNEKFREVNYASTTNII